MVGVVDVVNDRGRLFGADRFDLSGGASSDDDFRDTARTAVINKRSGVMGLISGRKAFQRPMSEGVKLLHTIQDVFLDESNTVASFARIVRLT